MKKLLLALMVICISNFGQAAEYICIQPGDNIPITLPTGLALPDSMYNVTKIKSDSNAETHRYSVALKDATIEIYIDDDDGELKPISYLYNNGDQKILFKASDTGVAHRVTLLVLKDNMPTALTSPISIEVREEKSDCQ